MRVSVRGGPGFLGHLSSFFNVPGLFGSVPLQSNNYLGSDCADTLVAARGKWLGRESDRNYNVAALVTELPRVAEFDLAGGTFSKRVEWGRPVLPGDFVAVRYKGARSYQHVGALTGDTDGDGVLSGEDTTYQAGPWPLAETPLNAGPFDGHVVVLRPSSPIKEKPIAFGEKRRKASADYSERHYGTGAGTTVTPRVVVLHWTNTATLKAAFNAFDKEELEGRPDIAAGGTLNVSAHFLVDRDGTIHRLMPETRMARHVIGLNLVAVGIENVGADNLTEDQVRANAWLVRDLKERYPTITHLIGHHEHQRLEGTPLWTEREAGYRTVKPDPGPGFMKKVRGLVADLGLVP
ncbi:MAG: N-acetylmuramoyl-L-alanine amidase [Elusimicrobia bacterium]|nr:N-acetylmuramoyl-L-alanine amidase [Elusimicrobiota bacterium]